MIKRERRCLRHVRERNSDICTLEIKYTGGCLCVSPRSSIRIGLIMTGTAIKSVALPFPLSVNFPPISWGFAIICV